MDHGLSRERPRLPDLLPAPGSATSAAGVQVVGSPWSGGALPEEEAQAAGEAAEKAATAMASQTRTVRLNMNLDALKFIWKQRANLNEAT